MITFKCLVWLNCEEYLCDDRPAHEIEIEANNQPAALRKLYSTIKMKTEYIVSILPEEKRG